MRRVICLRPSVKLFCFTGSCKFVKDSMTQQIPIVICQDKFSKGSVIKPLIKYITLNDIYPETVSTISELLLSISAFHLYSIK